MDRRSTDRLRDLDGRTGLTARDVTPEAFARAREKDIPGFGELFPQLSYGSVGTSMLQS